MLAEALFARIRARGFREIEFELTPHGASLGMAEVLPPTGSSFEFRVMVGARGFEPPGPNTRIIVPDRIAEALRDVA